MAIEQVAGETAGQSGASSSDVGAGPVSGNDAFALPNDFDSYVDEGDTIEIPPEGGEAGAGDIRPVPASGAGVPQTPTTTSQGASAPTAPTQPTGQQPVAPPAGQQPAQQQPAQTPVAAEGQPTGEGAAQRIYSPAELAQALGQNKSTMIEALAQQKFALSPEEIQSLEVDAVGVLPKIMARVYFEATVNGLQQIANMVPRMVEHVANTRIAESDSERAFFDAWPNIDARNAEQVKVVTQLSNSFRQMNPRASMEDAIKYVGQAATAFLGLQAPQRNSNGGQAPRGNNGGTPPRRTNPPFAPAGGGRAQPPAGTPTAPASPFAGMGMQFDEE